MIPCVNKSFKTNPNQEKSDWEMMVDAFGEDGANEAFVNNGFGLLSPDELPSSEKKEDIKTETTAEELDVIQQLKNLEVSTENKAAISDGLDALDEEINLIDTTENINALIPKLRQILSEDYFQISSVFDFEGTSFATLKITHPLIPLNQNPVPDPVAISQEIEREHQDFIGNSTFFSTAEVP